MQTVSACAVESPDCTRRLWPRATMVAGRGDINAEPIGMPPSTLALERLLVGCIEGEAVVHGEGLASHGQSVWPTAATRPGPDRNMMLDSSGFHRVLAGRGYI
jgi:hypothetical protein